MYNMEISIGSYKFRVEILIAIIVVFWILFGHLLCSCCRVNVLEGLVNIASKSKLNPTAKPKASMTNMNPTTTVTEGFTGANNVAYGPEFAGAKTPDYIMNPSTWSMPTLTYSPGTKPDAGVQSIWDRPKQPIPLPEGELDMFATTQFAPECCPNAYSSSMGCACMDLKTYSYLRDRGGNNVPYDVY